MDTDNIIMPMQPIKDGRFIGNRIVEMLLDTGNTNMNDIARMDFTRQERMQFAQLIGYSLDGFGELSYVDDETYETADRMNNSEVDELTARNEVLRAVIDTVRDGIRTAATAVFRIHPDDLHK